jgi:H+/Cl- antiporter ClcA
VTRFASPQPNVPGQGILAGYSTRFWATLLAVGAGAGLAAAAFVALLELTEQVAWGRPAKDFLAAVTAASTGRHLVVLLLAGAVAGAGGLALRRLRGSGGGEISEALWLGGARLALVPSLVRGVVSIVTVGMGASLGREAAPQLAGAALASELCDRTPAITPAQRRLLVASGAGAGMAAVYNVPLGGALFALEVLLGTLTLPLAVPALMTSVIATAVAWLVTGDHATYPIPHYAISAAQVAFAVVIGPLAGLIAVGWVRLVARANLLRPRRAGRLIAPLVVFAGLGALAIAYPQLLGNGKEVTQLALVGKLSLGLLAALVVLKPIVTAACLASGSPGGLFTPTLALGVLVGALLGHVWSSAWPGSPIGGYALIGGGAVLAAAMQGPLSATVLVLELSHGDGSLTVPLLLAIGGAVVVARRCGAPSIYSARLAVDAAPAAPPVGADSVAASPDQPAHPPAERV